VTKLPKEALEFFRQQGAKGGKRSAAARMKKLTFEQRQEIAKKAAAKRWANRGKARNQPRD
jgi:hypothetical protein